MNPFLRYSRFKNGPKSNRGHLGLEMGSFRECWHVISGSLRGHFGVNSGSFSVHIGIISGSFRNNFGPRYDPEVTPESPWNNLKMAPNWPKSGAIWPRNDPNWPRNEPDLALKWPRFAPNGVITVIIMCHSCNSATKVVLHDCDNIVTAVRMCCDISETIPWVC